jgi:uncharacterized Ntn-hydrolase superfamily protein
MVDRDGAAAAHTGSRCIAEAGHRIGEGYSVQANLMERATVWDTMAAAYERAAAEALPLAERLLAALDAAEAEGGDIRGQQSAAMLVLTGQPMGRAWEDRVVDLRVEDHPEPLLELRRLLRLRRAWQASQRGDLAGHRRALELAPELTHVRVFAAVALAEAGDWEEAMALLRGVLEEEPRWRETLRRLPAAGRLDAGLAGAIEARLAGEQA